MTPKISNSARRWFHAPACVCMMLAGSVVGAITPESGLYWNESSNGTGYSVDVQGNVVVLIVYSYAADGEPEFLTGAGTIRSDGQLPEAPYHFQHGVFPINNVRGTLLRPTNGREFNTSGPLPPGRVLQQAPVTTFAMTFLTQDSIWLRIGSNSTIIYRLNFGIGGFGASAFTPSLCANDYRGEWVFIDQSTPTRAPWRFNFTEVSVPVDFGCQRPLSTLVYRDSSRNAEMRCTEGRITEPAPPVFLVKGCEVLLDGQVLFSAYYEDLGLDRIIGSLGPLQTFQSEIMRRPERVLGMRVK